MNYEPTVAFFRDVLGLELAFAEPGWSVFKLPSGQRDFVEVYGPEKLDTRLFPESAAGPVAAFIVDDIERARAEVAAAGIEMLGDIVWAAKLFGDPSFEGMAWFFLRGPDGNTYCLEQSPGQA